MIKIGKFILSDFATNCYFVHEKDSKEVIMFDCGDRGDFVYDKLTENGFTIAAIYLTHGHYDHIYGVPELKKRSGAKVVCLDKETEFLADTDSNLTARFGTALALHPDETVRDGQTVTEAGVTFQVIATPGHTIGGCCFYFEEDQVLIAGDTLFEESVGRTDFPTGSASSLVRSIREKLFVLPDETRVFPGHGEATTIGHEKVYNPCL